MIRVVVVTDRKIFGSEEIAGRVAAMLMHVPRGSVAIQVREKDLDGGPLMRLVSEVIEVARPAGAPVFVNDRVDVALMAGADGVHLPERGMSVEDARAIAPALQIGCSRHTSTGVLAAAEQGAGLVHFGPIWTTPGKPEPIGIDALDVRSDMPSGVSLVAVGGIDGPVRAHQAALAGADAVAVIRAAWHADIEMVARIVDGVAAGVAARNS